MLYIFFVNCTFYKTARQYDNFILNMLIIKWVIKIVNIMCALALAAAFISSRFSPEALPYVSVAGMFVPVLILVNVFFVVFWAVKMDLFFLYSLFALLAGLGQVNRFFAVGSWDKTMRDGDFRVMSYNVRSFNRDRWTDDSDAAGNISKLLKELSPDIVCFQEYAERMVDLSDWKYKYVVISAPDGNAIFSKYPIVNKSSRRFEDNSSSIYADIRMPSGRIVRVYCVHLNSLGIAPGEVNDLPGKPSDEIKSEVKGLIRRLDRGFRGQQKQIELLRADMDSSPYPNIVMGDFNNTPFSYTYRTVLGGDMTDAFSEAGFGFGRTFRMIRMYPLRIDFIMADENAFEVRDFSTIDEKSSDHNPVTAVLGMTGGKMDEK